MFKWIKNIFYIFAALFVVVGMTYVLIERIDMIRACEETCKPRAVAQCNIDHVSCYDPKDVREIK